jgi:hypothetical protein
MMGTKQKKRIWEQGAEGEYMDPIGGSDTRLKKIV